MYRTIFNSLLLWIAVLSVTSSAFVVFVQPQLEVNPEDLLLSDDLEDVCELRIINNYQPFIGHTKNGSKVEIQQDEESSLMATFVECKNGERHQCHGIDKKRFSSQCVTIYDFRPAGVRLLGSTGPFHQGSVRFGLGELREFIIIFQVDNAYNRTSLRVLSNEKTATVVEYDGSDELYPSPANASFAESVPYSDENLRISYHQFQPTGSIVKLETTNHKQDL